MMAFLLGGAIFLGSWLAGGAVLAGMHRFGDREAPAKAPIERKRKTGTPPPPPTERPNCVRRVWK